jgi:hypothetical protein
MRAYQLTSQYAPPPWRPDVPDDPYTYPNRVFERWLLELDEYELVNLQRLLDAVAGKTREFDVPVTDFNNGDWVRQIGFYLPGLSGRVHPNRPYPEAAS